MEASTGSSGAGRSHVEGGKKPWTATDFGLSFRGKVLTEREKAYLYPRIWYGMWIYARPDPAKAARAWKVPPEKLRQAWKLMKRAEGLAVKETLEMIRWSQGQLALVLGCSLRHVVDVCSGAAQLSSRDYPIVQGLARVCLAELASEHGWSWDEGMAVEMWPWLKTVE